MSELDHPYVVSFPLRGEWTAVNTPAKQIPSHGTDQLGQRYAYDFLRLINGSFFKQSKLQYATIGVPTKLCYCWGESVYAVSEGEVVAVQQGIKENKRIHFVIDLMRMLGRMIAINVKVIFSSVDNSTFNRVLGNFVIIKHNDYYSLYAHLQPNSVNVKLGQHIKEGDSLGKIGNTGNSTAPHLHFQLMDSDQILTAKGLPCAFQLYEVAKAEEWTSVSEGIPNYNEIIRK